MGIYRLIIRFLETGSSLAQVSRCHIVGVSNQPISTAETKRQLKSRKCSNGEIRICPPELQRTWACCWERALLLLNGYGEA